MADLSRRTILAGAGAAPAMATPLRDSGPQGKGIKMALIQSPYNHSGYRLAKQIGINYTISTVLSEMTKVPKSQYLETLQKIKADAEANGSTISAVESHPVPAEKIKLGIDGRDEEIENYIAAIEAMGKAGIPVICYNFMAGLGWYRTKVDVRERGGALTSEFDNKAAKQLGLTKWGEIPEEKIWANIEYFLKAVIPVAERANVKMALHPDDPPLTPLRGIGRICISAKNFRRIMNLVPSPVNGVTYCQANFVAMGEDIEALAKEWMAQKKIFFVHFRDITGKGEHFRETFHDNGPTDMGRMLRVYTEGGFDGPMRPDHAPTLEGEENDRPGYAMKAKIYALGYFKGLLEGMKLPYS